MRESLCGVRWHQPGAGSSAKDRFTLATAVAGLPSWIDANVPKNAWVEAGLRVLKTAVAMGVVSFGGMVLLRRWVAVQAGVKFRSRAALYLTIPAIAGLLNWATNQLAVWMIFNPLEFVGLPLISRPRPGEPLGWGGWQGIVPAKVEKMAGDIVDLTLNELIDVTRIFGNIDERKLLAQIQQGPALLRAVADAADASSTLPHAVIVEARQSADGAAATLMSDVLHELVARVILRVVRGVAAHTHSHRCLHPHHTGVSTRTPPPSDRELVP